MKTKRGRPRKGLLEKLRTRLWYEGMRRTSGWTDYELDVHFRLYRPGAKAPPGKDRPPGEERSRIFEEIRKSGRDPTHVKNGGRVIDLVALAGADATFREEQRAYNAAIWWLVSAQPDLEQINHQLDATIKDSGVARVSETQQDHLWQCASKIFTPERLFGLCVEYCLIHMTLVDRISLIGLLYRQLDLCGHLEYAAEMSALFDRHCEYFCFYKLSPDESDEYAHYTALLEGVLGAPRPKQTNVPGTLADVLLSVLPTAVWRHEERLQELERILKGETIITA